MDIKSEKSSRRWPRRWAILSVFVIVAAALVYVGIGYLNYRSAINATLEWGRLDPFPGSATDLKLDVEGNMFTRAFRVKFRAPLKDIDAWLAASPGTSALVPQQTPDGVRCYEIKPGGGANEARLNVDQQAETVEVYVAWS